MTPNAQLAVASWHEAPRREVYLCAVGARTPVGLDSASSSAAVRAGISAIKMHPLFVDKTGSSMRLANDSELSPQVALGERLGHLLAAALAELLEQAEWSRSGRPLPCWIGLPEPRPGVTADVVQTCARAVIDALRTTSELVHRIHRGHASGLMAIQVVAQQIATGQLDLGIAAGVDSYYDSDTLDWLDQGGQLMSGSNRNGFPPGEAAGACLLASGEAVRHHRLPVLARVAAACTAVEPHPLRSLRLCVGEGLTAAVAGATESLSLPRDAITATYCDINGERYRSEELAYTLLRTQAVFVNAHDYLCPANCWGDVGAASGPLFASLAVASRLRGYAKGAWPLLWAGGEGGYRSAVVLSLGGD
ncbi:MULTISPECIES: beta-ketoacyl synthase N-terminal-like domain-containing protein [unclassified Caballeronia]|uniref:beta-ketoacyl synthase N-terminal-like domain-containing protein n=1 Tax=unclassified Caballeronia TaxID=2646786 RepID=UPI00285F017E|nr:MULTISPECIES: beta-ketoacyl synthase N-terminal-like domain-containing protein [unclassified Caballeronia]MDR5741130.1 beta-ketoacyl synthase N-terminal-like domain-containing protein [Caballeronia sp. LZ016]MDR5807030.1 beta-ketoacyl synthase N-terminal-like domain-containing protein [Caballeronia sp. LZ019]